MCKVVNLKKDSYTVYIGRPSPYGNPFKVGVHGKRGECVQLFKDWFYSADGKECREAVKNNITKDSILGCFCKPGNCHGDVIAEYVNNNYQTASLFYEIESRENSQN